MICKILGLFVDTLTTDDKYSFLNRDNLIQSTQMKLSKKQKPFFDFFLHFWNLYQILDILKITLIADVFPKLQTTTHLVR